MRSDSKYVVFNGHNGEEIIVFPKIIQHSVMADDVLKSSFGGMRPISGGFVVNGECVGESISLRMKSRGDRDTALIAKMLDHDELVAPAPKTPARLLTKNQRKRANKKRG